MILEVQYVYVHYNALYFIYCQGTVEILTPSTLGRAAKDFTTADQFTDLGVYQRLKVPNQCSRYRNLSLCDRRAFISLDLLTPYSICVS